MDGTYTGQFDITKAGTTWVSENRWGAKINGNGANYGITLNASNITVIGFEVYNCARIGILSWTYNPANVFTNNCIQFCRVRNINPPCDTNGGGGIVLSTYTENSEVAHCWVHDIGAFGGANCVRIKGIYATGQNCRMINNVVYRTIGYGLDNWDRAKNGIILNNLVFNNQYGGISLGSDTSGWTVDGYVIANNIIINNGTYGIIEVQQTGTNTITNNLVWGQTTNLSTPTSTPRNTLNTDPLFVRYSGNGDGDYRLAANSPCINYGVLHNNLPSYDIDGNPRVVDQVDLGPYESQNRLGQLPRIGSVPVPRPPGITDYVVPHALTGTAATTYTFTANTTVWIPWVVTAQISISTLALNVTTAATGSATIAIYSSNLLGQPNSRLYVSGTLDTGTTGVKTATSVNLTLGPGIYWFAVHCTAAAVVRAVALASSRSFGLPSLSTANTIAWTTSGAPGASAPTTGYTAQNGGNLVAIGVQYT